MATHTRTVEKTQSRCVVQDPRLVSHQRGNCKPLAPERLQFFIDGWAQAFTQVPVSNDSVPSTWQANAWSLPKRRRGRLSPSSNDQLRVASGTTTSIKWCCLCSDSSACCTQRFSNAADILIRMHCSLWICWIVPLYRRVSTLAPPVIVEPTSSLFEPSHRLEAYLTACTDDELVSLYESSLPSRLQL